MNQAKYIGMDVHQATIIRYANLSAAETCGPGSRKKLLNCAKGGLVGIA